ncbi:MAG: hypothetical protein WA130_10565 [Candidatus Methanoperedens sp.]
MKKGILFPLVKVEMQAKVEPHAVQPGRILTFSINVMNAGEVDWKRAKVVISIHDEKHIMIKKLIKRINNMKIGERKSVESPWRIPKRMKNGEYGYIVSAYYSRKKIGSETGEFRVVA